LLVIYLTLKVVMFTKAGRREIGRKTVELRAGEAGKKKNPRTFVLGFG